MRRPRHSSHNFKGNTFLCSKAESDIIVTWYFEFLLICSAEGEEYYLEFCGANASADVYVNGKKLAHHDGGYSTWRVKITEELKDDNLVVVAVDNGVNDRVYPQQADFTFYGGLYRKVSLIAVPKAHFELEYYGTPRDELFLTEELNAAGQLYLATEDGSAGTKGNVLDAVKANRG